MVRRLLSVLAITAVWALHTMAQTATTVSVTTTPLQTDGTVFYTTFVSNQPLDFTTVADNVRAFAVVKSETRRTITMDGYEAFSQAYWSLDAVTVKGVQKVPANTGIVIMTKRPGTYHIPVAEGNVPAIQSSLTPVGTIDKDAYDVVTNYINDPATGYVDDSRVYYVPYVLERKNGKFGFHRERPNILSYDENTSEPIFQQGQITLKRNTCYLPLDYWQDMMDNSASGMEGNGVNQQGFLTFEAGGFDEEPVYSITEINVPVGIGDGLGYYIPYYNKNQDLDFSQTPDLEAYIVTCDSTEYQAKADLTVSKVVCTLNLKAVSHVPAATPIILKGNHSGVFNVPTLDPDTRIDDVSSNALLAIAVETDKATMLNDADPIVPYELSSSGIYVGFGANLPDTTADGHHMAGQKLMQPGTVYLPLSKANHEYVQRSENRILPFGVRIEPKEEDPQPVIIPTVDITVDQHATGDHGYFATLYTGDTPLDFTSTEGISAYILTADNTTYYPLAEQGDSSQVETVVGRIDLKQIAVAPAHTAIIVYAHQAGTYSVPEASDEAGSSSIQGNILVYADTDIDVDNLATQSYPAFLYTMQSDSTLTGFAPYQPILDEQTQKHILPQGTIHISLSYYDNDFVSKSEQRYLPFGVSLTLPEPQKPDTPEPGPEDPDPKPEPTTIEVNGMIADASGNYATFYSPDKTLDFSQLSGIKAYIVTAREEQYEGSTVTTCIDLMPISHVPAATPIIVFSYMPDDFQVPQVADEEPLDDVSQNILQAATTVPDAFAAGEVTYNYLLDVIDEKAGFQYFNVSAPLAEGTVYVRLTQAAHDYVQNSVQHALIFGQPLEVSAISSVSADTANTNAVYTLSGTQRATPQRGVNILRLSDGTTRKVLAK